jgi:hypothetical protein
MAYDIGSALGEVALSLEYECAPFCLVHVIGSLIIANLLYFFKSIKK